MRYLREGRIEVLCQEIESSTGIKLKTILRWLISEVRLKKRLETGNGRGSAIVITVGNEADISKLCAKRLRFGGAPKVVEKYWEAGPSFVCITCSGIGHDRLGGCNEKPAQCVICAEAHKSENYKCGVTGCVAKAEKICIHVILKCANCGGNHQATPFKCPARQKAQAVTWKNRSKKPKIERRGKLQLNAMMEKPQLKSTRTKRSPLNRLKWNSILTPAGQEALESNLQILAPWEIAHQKMPMMHGNVNYTT